MIWKEWEKNGENDRMNCSKKKVRGSKKDTGKGIYGFIFLNMNGIHIQENNNKNIKSEPSLVTGQLLF